MKDSNSFHATCLDTYPPIRYLRDVSFAAIGVVEDINKKAGRAVAAYTFDAGPNAVIYYEEKDIDLVAGPLKAALGELEGWQDKGIKATDAEGLDSLDLEALRRGISRVILTGVGEGPIETSDSLISKDGEPLR